jgi:hypothetical protein
MSKWISYNKLGEVGSIVKIKHVLTRCCSFCISLLIGFPPPQIGRIADEYMPDDALTWFGTKDDIENVEMQICFGMKDGKISPAAATILTRP